METLNIIATPIGNRADITIRALKALFELQVLACEDTRKSKQLMDYYKTEYKDILGEVERPRLVSYFEQNEAIRADNLIELIKEEVKVGLVSNAGMPTISDPGYILVKKCLEQGIGVRVFPGANAAVSALAMSGYSSDKFTFLGFLPRKKGKQLKIWEDLNKSELDQTIVFYESPFRLLKTLNNIEEVFGEIEIGVARELTKVYEEMKRQKISEWKKEYENKKVKGELVVVFRKENK